MAIACQPRIRHARSEFSRSQTLNGMKRHPRSNIGHSTLWTCLSASCALVGVACEGSAPRDLGSSSAPYTLEAPFHSDINEFVGSWVGSAEDILGLNGERATYQFPSGSTQIVLDVAPGENNGARGPLEGFIRFGSGAPLAEPTDPDSGYPAGVSYDALLGYGDDGLGIFVDDPALPPFEGADYPVGSRGEFIGQEDGTTTAADGVISFTFSRNQPLDAWCQLQTPHLYEGSPDSYSCLPNTGGQLEVWSPGTDAMCAMWGPVDLSRCTDPSDWIDCFDIGEPVASINCDKAFLCRTNDYCTCSADGCTATDSSSRLTVRRVGDELVGVFQNTVFVNERDLRAPLGEVRLQRSLEE
jgi:hypothetical protein